MCHNSLLENEQIEKCIENGMPIRLVNTIKNTLRKRLANKKDIDIKQQQIEEYQNSNNNNGSNSSSNAQIINPKEPNEFVSKCPFGHGKFKTPQLQGTLSISTVTPSPAATDNELELSNKNNNNDDNLLGRFSQVSQLSSTKITTTAATDNGTDITNLTNRIDEKLYYNDDILAKSTQLTKGFMYTIQQAIRRLQSNRIYTLLTKTTQPAHIAAIVIVTFVFLAIWPELVDDNITTSSQESAHQQQHIHPSVPRQEMPFRKTDKLALIAYLGAFSTHFGTQIWMTFVSGLSLYFSLPRHIFGQCQQVLFPKYFAMNAILSITMLILYVKFLINTWTLAKCVQFGSLALTSAIELLVRLYLAPPLLRLMHEKYKIEGSIGSGNEIGSLVQGDLTKCPHYQRIHKAFRRLHMTVAIGNMITMAGSCLQLYNIAGQLQISVVH